MLNSYYKIPVNLRSYLSIGSGELAGNIRKIAANKYIHPSKRLKKSICDHINVLLLSRYGENRADHFYGLELWNHEFELKELDSIGKEKIMQSIVNTIEAYEKRVKDVSVDEFNFHLEEVRYKEDTLLLYLFKIEVSGYIKDDSLLRVNSFHHKIEIPVKVYYRHKS